jgi:hypothetical protein
MYILRQVTSYHCIPGIVHGSNYRVGDTYVTRPEIISKKGEQHVVGPILAPGARGPRPAARGPGLMGTVPMHGRYVLQHRIRRDPAYFK